MTGDIDVILGVGTDKFKDIIAVAGRLGLKILVDEAEDFVGKTMVLPALEEKSGIRIDLIFSYSPYEKQAIERARSISFGPAAAVGVCFAALEDLVIHKVIAGRP